MRNTLSMLGSIAVTVLGFGLYGPTLRSGQLGMSKISGSAAVLRPFVCVGLAYFLMAVVVPTIWLHMRGENGAWTLRGIIWSIAGGALGAIGAFAIILAYKFGGHPIWVMPLVFGGAPAVNAFLTVVMAGKMKEIGPWFLAGLIIVVLGVIVISVTRPYAHHAPAAPRAASNVKADSADAGTTATRSTSGLLNLVYQFIAIACAVISWGAYGPVLHKGQAAMHHSRMRPFICVGLAYLAIAVILPYFFLGEIGEASSYRSMGTLWSFLAGAFAACGALGIIMAFNFGGKPIFVMPLVFGGAPVVSTFTSITMEGQWGNINPWFGTGLILVIAGAVMVLILAPRGAPAKASAAVAT